MLDNRTYGGAAQDDAESTAAWNRERASHIRLLEVRGKLPEQVTCPETGVTFYTGQGTVPKRSHYICAECGIVQDVMRTTKASRKSGPVAGYAIQAYSTRLANMRTSYNGRFFGRFDAQAVRQYDFANREWESRKDNDLSSYWPVSSVPYGFMTVIANSDIRENYGYTHWWTMFNPRQLLVHAQLLKAITSVGDYRWETREYVLGAFQNYLRNQCMFAFWHVKRDHFVPALSNNNFHPKSTLIEVGVFSPVGYGPWSSAVPPLSTGREWSQRPWEAVSAEALAKTENATSAKLIAGRSERVYPGDPVGQAELSQGSSTDFQSAADSSLDLVITDPPFGGLLHYSELSDFFYVWLRLALKDKYPDIFTPEYTPKSLEAVANKAREPEDPDGFYQRLLTQCWREAHRILKPGGILAFTFHHSEDKPWISVLESLFDAGFYLEATYPIRSDETKGDGEFGSKTIEYDIIHVCRKRNEEPQPVSWARLRRAVMADVRQVQGLLENHSQGGLPAADVQVIRRGKALEYFSRHYGKVYLDEGKPLGVQEALLGINQLLEEDADRSSEPPPVNCEPMTRQFLRYFDKTSELKRDQLQKFLRGNVITPDDFVQLGWCTEKKKVFYRAHPLDVARDWSGKHKRRLTSDLDQALVLIGACFPDSGINAQETLKNENFKPHQALKPLLEWLNRHDPDKATRQAASRALTIFQSWQNANEYKPEQIFLEGLEE